MKTATYHIYLCLSLVLGGCLLAASCGQPPLHSAAVSNAKMRQAGEAIAGAAAAGQAATTRAAAAVEAAQSDVTAQAASQPTTHLAAAQEHLATASASLQQVNGQWLYVVDRVRIVQVESPKLQADLAAAQKQYDALSNLWVVRFYRFVARLSWTLLITLGVLALGLAIVGIWYGANKVTSPALGWIGSAINALKTIIDHAAWWIWSFVPIAGGYVYDWLKGRFTKPAAPAALPAPAAQTSNA